MGRLSVNRLTAEVLEGGSFTGDRARYVKAPDTGISLCRGSFTPEENLE
jgi:hypothetical protein